MAISLLKVHITCIRKFQLVAKGQASSNYNFQKVHKLIWKLQITTGDKVFLWKACLDALPTQANLFKKKMVEHPKCPIYSNAVETIVHTLWECESANDVWG